MKTEPASERLPIARIAVKGSCPVCAAVKHFQESLLVNLHPDKGARLCNFHAWSLAKSAPAEIAASVFLTALRSKDWSSRSPSPSACVACKKVREEEVTRIKEVSEEFKESTFGGWLREHARFCVRHLNAMKQLVAGASQKAIEESAINTASELQKELEEFLQQARRGNHAGGGVLGRAAEFLVAQRGILD
ncbi:MAG TPA: hypothetical protein VLW83_12815 [Candidatus Acidoferrales bacterium]|nr:hypothetical protein [Candidatus Acidoferrales bacterium]